MTTTVKRPVQELTELLDEYDGQLQFFIGQFSHGSGGSTWTFAKFDLDQATYFLVASHTESNQEPQLDVKVISSADVSKIVTTSNFEQVAQLMNLPVKLGGLKTMYRHSTADLDNYAFELEHSDYARRLFSVIYMIEGFVREG